MYIILNVHKRLLNLNSMKRPLKELLIILRDSLKEGDKIFYFNSGICGEIADLLTKGVISTEEHDDVSCHIYINKPNSELHSEFVNELFINYEWWWKKMKHNPKAREIRIEFLNKLIKEIDFQNTNP